MTHESPSLAVPLPSTYAPLSSAPPTPFARTAEPKARLDALTSMRFVAAFMVVVFHTTVATPIIAAAPRLLRSFIECGYVWVGFFFVLSGFVLSYQYSDRIPTSRRAMRGFLIARLARIYPGHLLGFALIVPLLLVKRGATDLPPGGTPAVVADVLATLGLAHSWIPAFALTFNFASWSIATEFFFYLCFPFLALVTTRWPLRRVVLLGLFTYIAAVAFNLAYCAHDPFGWLGNDWDHDAGRNFVKFFPLVRLPEFVLGLVAGRLFAERGRLGWTPSAGARAVTIAIVLILGGLAFGDRVPYTLMHNVALSLPFVALILGLALSPASPVARLLSRASFVALGEASYSVYILQALVLWLFYYRDAIVGSTNLWVAVSTRAAVLATVVGIALLSHHYIESPMRRRLRRFA